MSDILFCVNSVLPVFLVIAVGYFLRKIKLLNESFVGTADRLVFKVALPISLFTSISQTDFTAVFDPKLLTVTVCGILAIFLVMSLCLWQAIKKPDARGAVIQGIFRSNVAILGIPLASNIFGAEGEVSMSLMISFVVPVYNVLAVIILAMNSTDEKRESVGKTALKIVKNIVTNPLIIATVLALPFSFFGLTLPTLVTKSLSYLGSTATPLALLSIGAMFRFSDLKGNIGYSLFAVFCRLVLCPCIMCTVAILLGMRGLELSIILLIFGTPAAVSSYIMAKQMKSNAVIASQIVILSSLLCSLTLIGELFVLKHFGFI